MAEHPEISMAVIGAGISGMASAFHTMRTARRLGKRMRVVLFEKNNCPGGTWSRASIYPGLITNNTWDQMLFDDAELAEATEMFENEASAQAGPGGWRATGEGVMRVMERIAQQLRATGAEIKYSTEVTAARQPVPGAGWDVTFAPVASPLLDTTEHFDTLVVATGTFSTPALPAFSKPFVQPHRKAIDDAARPYAIHTSHLSDDTVQQAIHHHERTVVIVGASKSSLDAAERLASFGHHVHLVFRNSPYTAPPAGPPVNGKRSSFVSIIGSRYHMAKVPYFRDPVSGTFSTGGFVANMYRRFLHYTYIGSLYTERLFRLAYKGYSHFNKWYKSSNKDMIPSANVKWSEGSMFPGPQNLVSLIEGGVIKIIKGGVVGMRAVEATCGEPEGFELDLAMPDNTSKTMLAQGVIFGTGWNTGTYPFFTTEQMDELGLPLQYSEEKPPLREAEFVESDRRALTRISREIYSMQDPPEVWKDENYSARRVGKAAPKIAPYRLYRLLVPVSHLTTRDIVFPGLSTCKANHVCFMVQSHWIADYLLGLLPCLPSEELAREEISMQAAWSRKLFGPAHGLLGQWVGGAWIEYNGRLCWDMGVPDIRGWKAIVTSSNYYLEEKRVKRDINRNIGNADIAKV